MLTKPDLEALEATILAPYAMASARSRGRDHAAGPDDLRTDFQRDRDRIIHSTAFRKLEYKTQVYMVHHGDYFRTRITHTMEVAQIARTLARDLRLNQDLTEAIALAHDLGHTPFGHSGEAALKRLLAGRGGFEHNEQGLRVVEHLEERSPVIPGLNLTWEVREGIIKHDTEYDSPAVPERFRPDLAPTLESQVVDVADEIAYNNHDLDDALKMGLIVERDLRDVPHVNEAFARARSELPDDSADKFVKYRAIGGLIGDHVRDVLVTSSDKIARLGLASEANVRAMTGERVIRFSESAHARNRTLKDFLMRRVYRHPHVARMNAKAERFMEAMFGLYHDHSDQLPLKHQARIDHDGLTRVVVDYISGMTDRYLVDEYTRAFLPTTGAL